MAQQSDSDSRLGKWHGKVTLLCRVLSSTEHAACERATLDLLQMHAVIRRVSNISLTCRPSAGDNLSAGIAISKDVVLLIMLDHHARLVNEKQASPPLQCCYSNKKRRGILQWNMRNIFA